MPDVWPKIKAEADQMLEVADGIAIGERSTGGLPMFAASAGSILSGYNPLGLSLEAFGAASAWSLMAPSGKATLNGVFKYGLKPATKTGLHMGGKTIEMEKSH
jgi:hypothetical protein